MNKNLKRSILRNLQAFAMSSTLVGGGVFLYLYYQSSKNYRRYDNNLNDDNAKDMTRIGYEYYGINWGNKADSMIKDKIDTGDLLFLKYECNECITFGSMLKCYVRDFMQYDYEYDTVGIAYRDVNGLFVISPILGEAKKMTYAEFLSQPYFREVCIRKLVFQKNSLEASKRFFNNSKVFFDNLFPTEEITSTEYTKTPEEFLKDFFVETTLADKQMKEIVPPIADYDSERPTIARKQVKYDSKIIIRSRPNPNLEA